MSRRVGHRVLGDAPWMRVAEVRYKDRGTIRTWNVCERTKPTEATCKAPPKPRPPSPPPPTSTHPHLDRFDAVDIAAIVTTTTAAAQKEGSSISTPQKKLIVISQYRPPVDAVVLEFPAGMIDPGESPETTALRELKEETGYTASSTILHSSQSIAPLAYEPGLTNSCFAFVTVAVDGDSEENVSPKTELEEDEDIEVHLVDYGEGMMDDLKRLVGELDGGGTEEVPVRTIIDGKLFTFASALSVVGKISAA